MMIAGTFGPWMGGSSGFWLARRVAYDGWVVLAAGLTGGVLAVRFGRSSLARACALVAGTVAAASVFDVRDAVNSACPEPGGGPTTLGIFCAPPSVGWGLELATVGALGLVGTSVVALAAAGIRRPPRVPRYSLREIARMAKKYGD
jgi:hypothetical protein